MVDDENLIGTRLRGPYRRFYAVPAPTGRLVQCICGTRLRVAGAWTCLTCGTCHRTIRRTADVDETETIGG